MENKVIISVASFSDYPSGRVPKDGDYNGQRFREDFLAPELRRAVDQGKKVVVTLKGVWSFGSSFLEEAFGGLVRVNGFTKPQLDQLLEIEAGEPENEIYKRSILRHIERAQPRID